jgi:NAD(P)-dependent dehydrogenase (short-subunit alcohol dehydrogenase family)
MILGLSDKVAIVTGGSEGIGYATAGVLLEHGASVAIAARRSEVLERAAESLRERGGKVLPVVADVTKREDIERLVESTVALFGRLDILVNNAGTGRAAQFEDVDEETWHADLDLKLHAAVRTSRAALPHLKRRGGRIINVTTWGGKQPGAKSLPTTVSRAAGIAFTKALSKDLAVHGILVNTVCVGVIKSGQQARRAAQLQQPLDDYYAEIGRSVPLGRVGEAEEVANVIAFLASTAASYVTGASINIDGGASGVV